MNKKIEVMAMHPWVDEDIVKVIQHDILREIVFADDNDGSIIINKADVIALAKEFGLVVYNKDSNL